MAFKYVSLRLEKHLALSVTSLSVIGVWDFHKINCSINTFNCEDISFEFSYDGIDNEHARLFIASEYFIFGASYLNIVGAVWVR